jgi:hypothetical protein
MMVIFSTYLASSYKNLSQIYLGTVLPVLINLHTRHVHSCAKTLPVPLGLNAAPMHMCVNIYIYSIYVTADIIVVDTS